jgi:hypothetical protein
MLKCKKCNKPIENEEFMGYCSLACLGDLSPQVKTRRLNVNQNDQTLFTLDYHGLRIFDVKIRIIEDIVEAYQNGAEEIRIVHGFKHGRAIKTYLWQKSGMMKDFQRVAPEIKLKLLKGSTRGVTIIRF